MSSDTFATIGRSFDMTEVRSPYKEIGEARQLKTAPETVKGKRTGYFLARYVDLEGHARQAGRFERKGDANNASLERSQT